MLQDCIRFDLSDPIHCVKLSNQHTVVGLFGASGACATRLVEEGRAIRSVSATNRDLCTEGGTVRVVTGRHVPAICTSVEVSDANKRVLLHNSDTVSGVNIIFWYTFTLS